MLFCKIFRVYELRIQPRGETSKGSGSKARALKQGLQKNKAKAGFFPSSDQALRPVCIVIVENLAKICKNDSRAQMGQKPKAGSIASFCHTRARPGSTLISSSLAGARQTWARSIQPNLLWLESGFSKKATKVDNEVRRRDFSSVFESRPISKDSSSN